MDLRSVSDESLLSGIVTLVAREREVLLEILFHLREIERRRLYSDLRQPSLFAYCVNVLKYSNAQADRRIKAMRLIKELPQVQAKLASGELSLTNIAKAKEFFNQEDKAGSIGANEKLEILEALESKSTREAEKILLSYASSPAPEVKERVRQVNSEFAEVKFAANEILLEKLERLRGLLAHKNPNMKTSELINELCDIALAKVDPQLKGQKVSRSGRSSSEGASEKVLSSSLLPKVSNSSLNSQPAIDNLSPTSQPAVNSAPPSSLLTDRKCSTMSLPAPEVKAKNRNYISIKIKSEVWRKAEGRCQICRSTFALEIDHAQPLAQGGSSERGNLRLLCRSCNQRAAIVKIGEKTMRRYLP